LIDTPGIREFALWDMKRDEIALYFSDFNDYYLDCKYLPCTHIHEPNCKVIEAVENGLIDSERYQSYLNIYETLQ
jgi:ribosome biogenesis GTPase